MKKKKIKADGTENEQQKSLSLGRTGKLKPKIGAGFPPCSSLFTPPFPIAVLICDATHDSAWCRCQELFPVNFCKRVFHCSVVLPNVKRPVEDIQLLHDTTLVGARLGVKTSSP
jgi:hypothetical protein